MRRIVIIGLGLIGGSIGLALKQAGLEETELVGYTRSRETAIKALDRGAVDKMEDNLGFAVDKANMVILATPPIVTREILEQIGPRLPQDCTVTDTASTKVKVMEWAKEYLPKTINFVGGHPMAGKELSGVEAAEANLFQGCTYCLIPGESASPAAVQVVSNVVNTLGANPLFINAWEHDYLVAGVSHLPLILSSALVMATTKSSFWEDMSGIAAGGYRDLTRLASQHPGMNRDICLTNQQNILDWIDEFMKELKQFQRVIARGGDELEKTFVQSQQARQGWIEKHGKRD